jgi:hypothetical protein
LTALDLSPILRRIKMEAGVKFSCENKELDLNVVHLAIAGWTGRDRAKVQHHIDELAEIGVAPPSTVPLFYRASSLLLTQSPRIEVVGDNTSGEIEPLIVMTGNTLYLGLGSDHTDRALEAHSVALSKQICPKPASPELWLFDRVKDRLDAIEMTSWINEGGDWTVYQRGDLSGIRPLEELIAMSDLRNVRLRDGDAAAMMCGTLGVTNGGVRPASAFRMELRDPVLGRTIAHQYEITALPVVA